MLRLGAVHLSCGSLARSIDYYTLQLGLQVHRRGDDDVALGTGSEDLLVLHEERGARPADGFCGLFHFALLVPAREDLARWLLHAARERVAMTGMSDHEVSEALYLRDPDGHGIEIYADRPREHWEGRVAELMTTRRLDTDALIATVGPDAGFDGLAEGTVMGHVHLRVAELAPTEAFYRDLGLDVVASLGAQATFLSVDGYHHHLGANVWESAGAPPAPAGTARLLKATATSDALPAGTHTDPSGNVLEVLAA